MLCNIIASAPLLSLACTGRRRYQRSVVLYCIVLYCIVLYCIVLYWIVLYCIVLYSMCLLFYLFFLIDIVISELLKLHSKARGVVSTLCRASEASERRQRGKNNIN